MTQDQIRADIIRRAQERRRIQEMTHQRSATATDRPQPGSILDPLMQGASFGFADEIGGAVAGVANVARGSDYGSAYAAQRDRMRDNLDAYRERNPVTSGAAEIVGAVPYAFAPGVGMARAKDLGQAVRRGMATGATGGSLYGFGQGEGTVDRVVDGFTGGVMGTAIGMGLPLAGAGAKSALRAAVDFNRPNPASQMGVGRPAQRHIAQTLADEDLDMQTVGQRAQGYGPEAALVDASSGLRSAADTIVQTGRPGYRDLERMARERADATPRRIEQAFESVMGPRPDEAKELNRLQQALQQRARQNFGAAEAASPFGTRVPYDASLQPVLDEQRAAMARARVPQAALPDDTYDFLAHVQKRVTDERMTAERGANIGFRRSAEVQALRSDESLLVDALDAATGGLYKPARQAYRDDMAAKEAFDYGLDKALSRGERTSFFRAWWEAASPEEKDAARIGIRADLGRLAADARRARGVARDTLTEGDFRDRLEIAFGKETADRLAEVMKGQREIWTSNDALNRAAGSRTARAQADALNPSGARVNAGVSLLGLLGRGAEKLVDVVQDTGPVTRDLSYALSRQGPERDRLVQALVASLPQQTPQTRGMLAQILASTNTAGRAGTQGFAITQPGVPDLTTRPVTYRRPAP